MDMLVLILALSSVMWYVIDRLKAEFWAECSFCKWITISCAALCGFGLSFAYSLDIIYACGLIEESSVVGTILTGLVLMSGSGAISEVIARIKGEQ